MISRLITIALVFFVTLSAQAESIEVPPPTAKSYDPTFWNIFTNLPADMVDWWGLTFSRENAPQLAGVLGMTAAMIPADYETWMAVYRPTQANPTLSSLFIHGETWSSGLFQVSASAIFLAWGITGNKRALRTAFEIGETVLSSGIVVQVMKRATGRESPKGSLQRGGRWTGYPGEKVYQNSLRDYDAMPSGHLSSAFVIFQTIALNYPDQPWISWVGYPLMGFFAVSCVGNNIHWFSDFPIAIALGYSFAKISAYRYHPELRTAAKENPYLPSMTVGYHEASDNPLLVAKWEF
jgi:PAP2 superfamily